MQNDDVLDFAEYLGFKGIDKDLFYESYYDMEYDYELELALEEHYDHA